MIVYAGTDPLTGRRLRFRQTAKTEEQAQILLGRLLEQAAEGRQPETGVAVAELLRQYMMVAELALDAGLPEVKHPGHPYYVVVPGGQVFTIAPLH